MSQPTGRARGRARGRGRASAPAAGAAAPERRPGEQAPRAPPPMRQQAPPPQETEGMPVPGRGRSRGGATQPGPGVAPPQQQQREDLSAQMASMQIGASGEAGVGGAVSERRPRRDDVVIEPSTRPQNLDKRANTGQSVQLIANNFKVLTQPNWQLHQYRVDFEPQILNPRARFALIKAHENVLGSEMTLDMDTMYSRVKLAEKITNLASTRKDGSPVNIRCIHVATLNPMAPNTLHLYNVLFRKVLKMMRMEQIGRHYYNPSTPIDIRQHNLQLWPGFVTSILQYEYNVMLQADISHKVLRTQTVLEVMYGLYNKSRGNFKEEAKKKLIGEIVLTRYNNKTYRIDDIDFDTHPQDTFDTRDGPISFIDYFKKAYDRTLQDENQPMLVSRPKKREEKKGIGPIVLPPELCYLTGLSEDTRSDFTVMRDLAKFTRVGPTDRCKELTTFMANMKKKEEVTSFLNRWGMDFEERLVQFNGRVLPAEKIMQHQKTLGYDPKSADWSRDTRGNMLSQCVELRNWNLLYTRRDAQRANDFAKVLDRVGGPMGMNVAPPKNTELSDDRSETFTRALQSAITPNTQIVVIILPTNRKDRYDAIKKICVVTNPCPSQVIVSRTLAKQQMLMSVATKVAMQMNCKMGGDLWRLEIPLTNLMIIGIDSYHDSASRGRSVCGFVASMNKSQTSFFSRCSFQHTHGELADALHTHMTAALKRYHSLNGGKLPDRIIVYRDGVGDSQVSLVVDYELKQIIDAMDKMYPQGTEHKLAVVVVKKRINNRFFMHSRGNLSNPPPGTVIDDVVTKQQLYDFFIISQSVRQGTVSPTSYNVIYDKTGLKPDHMQRLTYKLTHLYFNWAGTVRVPAPCMYAHKLAFLIGQSVHQEHHVKLSDTLFYL